MFAVLLLLCATVASAQDFEVDGIYYNITDATNKTVEVARSNYTGSITIPVQVTNNKVTYTVTSIRSLAFYSCSGLTSVEIPNSVTAIQDQTFEYCTNLQSITIPNSVKSIGYRAFENCHSLQTVNLSEGLNSIGVCAFQYCVKLNEIIIPSSVTNVSNYAFRDCSKLESVTFCAATAPAVTDDVFNGISSTAVLRYPAGSDYSAWKLFFASTEEYATTIGGSCGAAVNWTLADGVLTITGNGAMDDFSYITIPWKEYRGDIKAVVIEDGVTSIGDYAFAYCRGLTSVEIPTSVKSIGDYAFEYCDGLTSVEIPNSVTSTGDYAFTCCYKLASIVIPNSVTSIGVGAFEGCYGLTNVEIPNSVTSIGEFAFDGCSGLTSVVIPNSVTNIGDYAFAYCDGLTSVEIPNSVTNIGEYAFSNCIGLESVASLIPAEKLFEINSNVFANCNRECTLYVPYGAPDTYASTSGWSGFSNILWVESGVIGGSCSDTVNWSLAGDVLTVSGSGAFTMFSSYPPYSLVIKIKAVVIEDGITYIDSGVLDSTPYITSLTIGSTVKSIGYGAFINCYNLTSVTSYISADNLFYIASDDPNFVYFGLQKVCTLYVPYGMKSLYTRAPWHEFTNIVELEPEYGGSCGDGVNWIFSDGVLTITGNGAMDDYSAPSKTPWYGHRNYIQSVVIENGVTTIGENAFNQCSSLVGIEIPEGVTSIGGFAFAACPALASVTSNATSAPSLGENAFVNISSDAVLCYPAGSDYSSWSSYFASTEMYGSVSGITLSASDVELNVNETYELTATVTPDDAFVKTISWSSSDNAIAVVDENGVVTAVAAGTATITATANDGSAVSASCNVTVIEEQGGDDEEVVVYENTIYVADTEAKTGTQVNLSICMDNVVDITSFQFDLYLPQGITIAKDEDDYHIIELSERATSRHTYESGDMPDGAVRVICYSTRNTIFSGNAGEVLSIPVNVSSDLADGEYEILVKEIELSTPAEVAYNVPVMTSSITVFSYITGDVNGDDKISVTDITGLVNLILDGAGYTANRAADVNEDGKISVTDITGIVNLILNSTNNATASAAPAQRTHRASSAGNNTMQIAPFAISAGEEKEISVLMDNPGDAFSAFQFNVYLPEGIELQSDEYGYLVDLGSRTTSRKHVVECAEQADGSILILCYSSKNSTFGGESGDVLVLPVKAAANLESGVYDIVMTDIEMARPDESNEFPADYTASVIAGEVRATELELNGYFTSESMDEISNAFANRNDITSIDISNAVHVDSEGNLTTGNSNTLVILPSNTAIANESNVVVDGMCENLQLTDNMAFGAPVDFTAVNVSYSRSFAAQTTATFVLPVSVPVDAINGKVYKLSAYEGDLIKFAKVTDAVLEANVPYVVVTDGAGELLNDNLRNAEVAATPAELSVSCANIKHVGSYNTLDVVSGTETYYGYSGGLFVKANNGTLAPFRTMIVAKGEASLSTSYRPEFGDGTTGIGINSAEDTDVIYFDIQGRRVDRVENGVYIINGKKTFIK